MNKEQQRKLMLNIFYSMMMGGHFKNQHQMTSELKAIYYLLMEREGLSPQECDDCLLYFFREYSKGCTPAISDTDIKEILVPTIKNYGRMDIISGASLIITAKDFL